MAIKITPITQADIPSAVDCIQVSFEDDPYAQWVFDKRPGKFNKERNFASLKAKCEWGIRNAMFFVARDDASDEVQGISMWTPPRPIDSPLTWSAWTDDYILWLKQGWNLVRYLGRGGLRTNRYWIWKREQATTQKELWTDPQGYYFCNIVTVRPGNQGKGIGRMLFEIVTKVADRDGRQCYLESSKEVPNIAIYEKMGFELKKKMTCDDDGSRCDLFCMFRPPKSRP